MNVSLCDLGFTQSEASRIHKHLHALMPHISPREFGIVGGLAIRYHAWKAGRMPLRRPLNDVDMVIKRTATLRPSVQESFLISHHHNKEGVPYFALVDPTTAIKADCFGFENPYRQFEKVKLDGLTIPVSSAEDQLAVTVRDLQKITSDHICDPKRLSDAQLLLSITDPSRAERSWRRAPFSGAVRLVEAFLQTVEYVKRRPELLATKACRRQAGECSECLITSDYPLTSLRETYAVLAKYTASL